MTETSPQPGSTWKAFELSAEAAGPLRFKAPGREPEGWLKVRPDLWVEVAHPPLVLVMPGSSGAPEEVVATLSPTRLKLESEAEETLNWQEHPRVLAYLEGIVRRIAELRDGAFSGVAGDLPRGGRFDVERAPALVWPAAGNHRDRSVARLEALRSNAAAREAAAQAAAARPVGVVTDRDSFEKMLAEERWPTAANLRVEPDRDGRAVARIHLALKSAPDGLAAQPAVRLPATRIAVLEGSDKDRRGVAYSYLGGLALRLARMVEAAGLTSSRGSEITIEAGGRWRLLAYVPGRLQGYDLAHQVVAWPQAAEPPSGGPGFRAVLDLMA